MHVNTSLHVVSFYTYHTRIMVIGIHVWEAMFEARGRFFAVNFVQTGVISLVYDSRILAFVNRRALVPSSTYHSCICTINAHTRLSIQPLLDLKELDLKKLGIQNSKDRARMLGSLANYRADREDISPGECK